MEFHSQMFQSLRYFTLLAAALATTGQAARIPLAECQGESTPATNASTPVKSLGTLSLSNVGFAEVIYQGGNDALFVSSFSLFGDSVHRINNIAAVGTVGLAKLKAIKITGSITWPNDITIAPSEIFGTEGVLVGGGFLVPTKTNGGIYYSAYSGTTSQSWIELISQSGWWYHRVLFADMDGDGKLDMVSCRADQPLPGSTKTMLVILKLKDASNPTGEWVETEIGAGCDALFTVADLDGDGFPEVIAPSYLTERLNVFHSKTGFANPDDVQSITVDSTIGAAFDAEYVAINGDGKRDLLISNHQGDGTGGVYAYEVPADVANVKGYTCYT
ncbi:putative FG-GAP repeat protein [Seiridium cardinale]|uniref:FG-GAP repeat protein n=1 Tax=Seiridium cardinale TaxID=138064 RepID=A0ABR2XH55_9PEZI